MYMLTCCCESLGTPLDYSIVVDGVAVDHRPHDDVGFYGTQQVAPDISVSTGSAEEKQLAPVDTTTTAEESTLFTEQCHAFKESPAEQTSQTPEGPHEPEFATADVPEVNHRHEAQQETTAASPMTAGASQMNIEHEQERQPLLPVGADATGVRYEGGYKNGKRNGFGILIRPCGSRYEGEFRDDVAHGYGTFFHISGDVYAGQWEANKAHGQGRFTHADGSAYEGQWVMDVQEGYGVERWTDGSSYEGYYVAGKKDGKGRFTWPNGSAFEGQFKDNEINGEGTYHWADGKTYTGQWVHNRMQGQGRMVLTDGGVHEGMYFQDRRHGRGRITWPDGHYFEGEWDAGKQVPGTGRYYDSQGREMGALNEIAQRSSGTSALGGKATAASSKSSPSVHVHEVERKKYQEPTAKDRFALKNGLKNVDQRQVRSTATRTVVNGSSSADTPHEQKRKVDSGRVEQLDVRENAEKKSSKRKVTSSAQHSGTQQHSTPHHPPNGESVSNAASSAHTNRTGGSSVNPEKPSVVYSGDAAHARRAKGDGYEDGHPHHQQQYERHRKETAEGPRREEAAVKGMKNVGSPASTSHAARGGSRKRAFESFFSRRK